MCNAQYDLVEVLSSIIGKEVEDEFVEEVDGAVRRVASDDEYALSEDLIDDLAVKVAGEFHLCRDFTCKIREAVEMAVDRMMFDYAARKTAILALQETKAPKVKKAG